MASISEGYAAFDFETATEHRSSACALSVVIYDNGQQVAEADWLIRPPDNEYNPFNSRLHGIRAEHTKRAAGFPAVWEEAAALIGERVLVAHNIAFDASVLRRSADYHKYVVSPTRFLCTYRLARSLYPDRNTWRLKDLSADFDIALNHHNALSDARAAGELLRILLDDHGGAIDALLQATRFWIGYLER